MSLLWPALLKMAKGAFVVFRDKENPRDINFQLASSDISSVPEEQKNLKAEIEKVLTVLRTLFPENENERFEEYFRPLLSLAQAGLVSDNPQTKISAHTLVELKNEIVVREGGRVKNKYMIRLGLNAILIACPLLIVALILNWLAPQLQIFKNFSILWVGCMAGVWISFGARKAHFRFEDLHIPEEDRLEPFVRLCFAGIITIIFGLMFSTGFVEVKTGEFLLADFTNNSQIALLLGMVLGFSETVLPSILASKTSAFIRKEQSNG